jgi:hypothetical protein
MDELPTTVVVPTGWLVPMDSAYYCECPQYIELLMDRRAQYLLGA